MALKKSGGKKSQQNATSLLRLFSKHTALRQILKIVVNILRLRSF